jgi:hypothetical protein
MTDVKIPVGVRQGAGNHKSFSHGVCCTSFYAKSNFQK